MEAPYSLGFDEPVHDAQVVFRTLLRAMSRPGSCAALTCDLRPPHPLDASLAALALALIDADTPIWVDDALNCATVRNYLALQTGASFTDHPSKAAFALVHDAAHTPPLHAFCPGDAYCPHRSTTVVICLPSLIEGKPVRLAGPGIEDSATIAPAGLPERFWVEWADNGARFPGGVDVVFVSGRHICGLPRTARKL